jgi:hypothetical protein
MASLTRMQAMQPDASKGGPMPLVVGYTRDRSRRTGQVKGLVAGISRPVSYERQASLKAVSMRALAAWSPSSRHLA